MNDASPLENVVDGLTDGDASAFGAMVALAYEEVHALIRSRRRPVHCPVLQTTLLANDVYLELQRQRQPPTSREHGIGIATMMLRRIETDYMRRHLAAKRGGRARHVGVDRLLPILEDPEVSPATWLGSAEDVWQLLARLDASLPGTQELIVMRCVAHLSVAVIAELHQCSVRSVERRLSAAKAWIVAHLREPAT